MKTLIRQLKVNEEQRIEAFYRKHGKEPPKVFKHGTEEEIRASMVELKPKEWKLQGNMLIAETDYGTHAQIIPSDVILVGTDENSLPIFKKVVLS